MERYQNGRDMASQYVNDVWEEWKMRNGVSPNSPYRPNVLDPQGTNTYKQPGAMNVPYGTTPSLTDVLALIEKQGGNPYIQSPESQRQSQSPGRSVPRAARQQPTGPAEPSMLEKLAAEFGSKINEANAANIARYDEGKGELSTLRDRNQSRVQNWGTAAAADVQEQMKEALGNLSASLASRGLANSNILPAFQERNARDTARELQRISEMRDTRASQYDTQDTNNLVGFVERRNDIAPDYGQLIGIADKIGQANALKAFQEQMAQQQAQQSAMQQNGSQGYNYGGYSLPTYNAGFAGLSTPMTYNLFSATPPNMMPQQYYSTPRTSRPSYGDGQRADGLARLQDRKALEKQQAADRQAERSWSYEPPKYGGMSPLTAYETARKQWLAGGPNADRYSQIMDETFARAQSQRSYQ